MCNFVDPFSSTLPPPSLHPFSCTLPPPPYLTQAETRPALLNRQPWFYSFLLYRRPFSFWPFVLWFFSVTYNWFLVSICSPRCLFCYDALWLFLFRSFCCQTVELFGYSLKVFFKCVLLLWSFCYCLFICYLSV